MASETKATLQGDQAPQGQEPVSSPEDPMLELSDAAIEKIICTAKEHGYVTHDQINSVLHSKELSSKQTENVLAMFSEMGINVVEVAEASEDDEQREEPDEEPETESVDLVEVQHVVPAKAEAKEPIGRTDDPVRMYLREMGSVELLSRQGEIAIAKRIEAGREAMIAGLCESPLTCQAIIIWRDELNEGKIFLRDIIDLEATYAGPDAKAVPVPVVSPDGRAIPPLPIAEVPPLAQTLAPSAMPAGATPFKPARMPAESEEVEVTESAQGEDAFDDDMESSLPLAAIEWQTNSLRNFQPNRAEGAPPLCLCDRNV